MQFLTSFFDKDDVRVTTHYHEDSFVSSMYSVIHEGGHALYDTGSPEEFADGADLVIMPRNIAVQRIGHARKDEDGKFTLHYNWDWKIFEPLK